MSPPTRPPTNRQIEQQRHAAARAAAQQRSREAERAVNHILGVDAPPPPANPGPPATFYRICPFAMTQAS